MLHVQRSLLGLIKLRPLMPTVAHQRIRAQHSMPIRLIHQLQMPSINAAGCSSNGRIISASQLLSVQEYEKQRRAFGELRRPLLKQIQEMLRIEGGGDEQVRDELQAYNPLVPQRNEVIMALSIEVPDKAQRVKLLKDCVGIDSSVRLMFNGHLALAAPISKPDLDSVPDSRASAMNFLRVVMTETQSLSFQSASQAQLIISHPAYDHSASIPLALLQQLQREAAF